MGSKRWSLRRGWGRTASSCYYERGLGIGWAWQIEWRAWLGAGEGTEWVQLAAGKGNLWGVWFSAGRKKTQWVGFQAGKGTRWACLDAEKEM